MPNPVRRIEPTDLTPDFRNANHGTARGDYMLETSMQRAGMGRSVLVDGRGNVIAGNKALQKAIELGAKLVLMEVAPDELAVVMRPDLDLTDPNGPARELAYADNRVAEVNLSWAADVLAEDLQAGVQLPLYWFDGELRALIDHVYDAPLDPLADEDSNDSGGGAAERPPRDPVEYCCPACGHEWTGDPRP